MKGNPFNRQGRLSGVWAQVSTSPIILASQRHGDTGARMLAKRSVFCRHPVLAAPQGRCRYYVRVTDRETEAQRSEPCPRCESRHPSLGPERAGGSSGAEDDAPRLPPTLQSAQLPKIPSAASGSSPVCLRCQCLQRGSCHRGTAWGRDQQSSWWRQNRRAENGGGAGGRRGRLDRAAHVGAAPTIAARVGRDTAGRARGG